MSTYLLNSAVLTEFGKFDYTAVTVEKARDILAPGFISAIGHEVTAAFCSQLLQLPVSYNRIEVSMKAGDTAVVIRLKQRLPEGQLLTSEHFREIGFEVGLLTCVAPVSGMSPKQTTIDGSEPRTGNKSPVGVNLLTRANGVLCFLWSERRTFLLLAMLLCACSLYLVLAKNKTWEDWQKSWKDWQNWDMFLTLATFFIGLAIFIGEAIEDWEERLPRRVSVFFQSQGATRMVCYEAHLAHEGDIRNWGQQIGFQMCDKQQLDFSPFLDVSRLGVQRAGDSVFVHFRAVIYLRKLPQVLQSEFEREAAKRNVDTDTLCKVLRARGAGTEEITFENVTDHLSK